ncbi:isocitrate lyase/PEP mutase family protein [Sphingomonas soli]|uniref:isocitrate lyase/PEP mutase family protein n=1 Tax=Sphingomonas soli TaxID=266127 RepID=UPI000836AB28|nr:isocitrate lyase/PEP mutase family protein [Sphingomonas soli]
MGAHVERLRTLLAPGAGHRLLSLPGCWDGLSALLIERAGFEAAFISGAAISMARLGRPDIGLVGPTEIADIVMQIRDRVALPLIVDGDTGFGDAQNVARTVRQYERSGASAIQIEDQTFPKRCGHMIGKSVVPIEEARDRIRAALDARSAMLVVARTDALAVDGIGAALDRAEAFLEEGADLIFVEGPRDIAEARAVTERFAGRAPLVVNLVEGGSAPSNDGAELEAMGFSVALHPLMMLHGLVAHAPGWLTRLHHDRSTEAFAGEIADLHHINAIVGD